MPHRKTVLRIAIQLEADDFQPDREKEFQDAPTEAMESARIQAHEDAKPVEDKRLCDLAADVEAMVKEALSSLPLPAGCSLEITAHDLWRGEH